MRDARARDRKMAATHHWGRGTLNGAESTAPFSSPCNKCSRTMRDARARDRKMAATHHWGRGTLNGAESTAPFSSPCNKCSRTMRDARARDRKMAATHHWGRGTLNGAEYTAPFSSCGKHARHRNRLARTMCMECNSISLAARSRCRFGVARSTVACDMTASVQACLWPGRQHANARSTSTF